MREIIFKAKRVDNSEWVEGYYVKCGNGPHEIFTGEYHTNNEQPYYMYEVDPETVCFASSRIDEYKVKIFSDDVVAFTVFDHNGNDTQYIGIVQWTGDRFIVVKSELDPFFGSDGPFDLDWVCDQDDTITVIGNIHNKKEGV